MASLTAGAGARSTDVESAAYVAEDEPHYYVEDCEDGALRANGEGGSRTDRQPLVAATLKGQRGKGGGGIGPEETLVSDVVPPLVPGSSRGGPQPMSPGFHSDGHVVATPASEEAATLTRGDMGAGVSPPGRHAEDDANLVAYSIFPDGHGQGADLAARETDIGAVGTPRGRWDRGTFVAGEPTPIDLKLATRSSGDTGVGTPGTGVGEPGDPAHTVTEVPPAIAYGVDTQNQLETGELSPTLRTPRDSSNGRDDATPAVVVGGAQAFEARVARNGRGAPEDVVPPLKAQSGQTGKGDGAPMVLLPEVEGAVGFIAGSSPATGSIGAEDEVAPTLGSQDNGSTRTGTVAYTKRHGAADAEDSETWDEAEHSRTLNSLQHATDVVVDDEPVGALQTGHSPRGHGTAGVNDQAVASGHVRSTGAAVRRLTPTECERLQGFPDGWTALGDDPPDGPRYAALGDAVTVNVAYWVMTRLRRKMLGQPPGPAAPAATGGGEVANTLQSQAGRGWSYDPEATYVADDEEGEAV